jgi:alkaline phosphatase
LKWSKFLVLFFLAVFVLNAQNNRPKNIIILIGDGMGINTVGATLLTNPDSPFNQFTSVGLSITCSADKLITDSAASATALATGYLTKNKYVGVDSSGHSLYSIFDLAENLEIATGIVLTSSVTHATPAGFFAETPDRNDQLTIASQMLNENIEVIIGGGTKYFLPVELGGSRKDSRNLIKEFKDKGYNTITDVNKLSGKLSSKQKILGLVDDDALPSALNRNFTLGELTGIALTKLQDYQNGFVLMIEGSQIDWAAHDHKSPELLAEMHDFESAITEALEFAKTNSETLVLVTADHETGGVSIIKGSLDAKDIELAFTTNGHTPSLVPIFAFGPGEENFRGILKINQIGQNLIKLVHPSHIF